MRRRAFTLIELVTSLAVASVVVVAMASSIGLASRALPDSSRPNETAIIVQRVLDLVAADARFATTAVIDSGTTLTLHTPDRDGDGLDDEIEFAWNGSSGDPLTRTHGTAGAASVIAAADDVVFAWATDAGTAEPTHPWLRITIRVGGAEMSTTVRCMNMEPR